MGACTRTSGIKTKSRRGQRGHTSFDSPDTAIVDKYGGAEAGDIGGEGDLEGKVEICYGFVVEVVLLGPEKLGVFCEDI
jgi:hypothetical protein